MNITLVFTKHQCRFVKWKAPEILERASSDLPLDQGSQTLACRACFILLWAEWEDKHNYSLQHKQNKAFTRCISIWTLLHRSDFDSSTAEKIIACSLFCLFPRLLDFKTAIEINTKRSVLMRGSNHPANTVLNIPHTDRNDSDSPNSIIKACS